jgi:hypothetical protein
MSAVEHSVFGHPRPIGEDTHANTEYADVVVCKKPTVVPDDPNHPIAGGLWSLTVDGVEMARKVTAGGLRIEFPVDDPGHAHVMITVAANVSLDLPDSNVEVRS